MLIAQALFLSERRRTERQTNKQANATERPTHVGGYVFFITPIGSKTIKIKDTRYVHTKLKHTSIHEHKTYTNT